MEFGAGEDDVQRLFRAKCDAFEELFRSGRVAEMVDMFYAEEASIEGKGLPVHAGRRAIRQIYTETREVCRAIAIRLDPVTVAGDVAYGGLTNVNAREDGETEVHRGIMIWRRIAGEWLVVLDFFFTDAEPGMTLLGLPVAERSSMLP